MLQRNRVGVRLGATVIALSCLVLSQPTGHAEDSSALITARAEIVVRERATTVTSINMSMIEQLPSGRRIEEVIAQLPTDRKLTPEYAPDGWSTEQKGKQVRAWGPGTNAVNLRFGTGGNYGGDYLGKPATLQGRFKGAYDPPVKLIINPLPKLDPTPSLEGILTVPPTAPEGLPLLIGVAPGYREGRWQFTTDSGTVPLLSLEQLRDDAGGAGLPDALTGFRQSGGLVNLLTRPEPRPFITAFPRSNRITGVSYLDQWGEKTVDAPLTIMPMPPITGSRWLSSGSALTFAGQAACVSGRFPTLDDAYGLLLDKKIELQPWGASPTSVMLGLPDTTAAGPHTISTPDGSSSITIGVLTVEGSLDQNKLWRGESTTMRLRVVGTDKPFPLAVINRTPEVISMEGGVRQVMQTPGGADNAITRSVTGVRKGNFTIVYSVNSPGCGG